LCLTLNLYCFYSSLQQLKDDIKAGRTPIHGVDIGGWLVAEHWMTSSSPAWDGVPDNVANQGEYQAMKYLGKAQSFSFYAYYISSVLFRT
jgi:hypothetical protein